MPVRKIEEALPEYYRKFLPDFFKNSIPLETVATCSECPMLPEEGNDDSESVLFSPESKCCTHYPNLHNYMVGGLLSNTDKELDEGRHRIRRQIKRRIGVTPHGVLRPYKYHLLLTHTQLEYFGRSEWLICPYYSREKGICTIRPFWNSVCNTWFCKYTDGYDGRIFWSALKIYMQSIEDTLTRYTLYKMGWDAKNIILPTSERQLTLEELDDKPLKLKEYRELWGDWAGREEEFYRETFAVIHTMTRSDFDHITGIAEMVKLEELKAGHKAIITKEPPSILKRNPELKVKSIDEKTCVLIGFSAQDPVEVSRRTYDILEYFDGTRSNKDVVQLLREKDMAEPTDELLLMLYRLRILVES